MPPTSNKKMYKELSMTESARPIFFRDGWLDAAAGRTLVRQGWQGWPAMMREA